MRRLALVFFVALVFFFVYAATLVVAGLWGALLAQFDFPIILDLELDEIPDDAEATLLSYYRFLSAVEFCFGAFALAYWRQIFERRIPYTKLGRHVRIAARDLDAFIRAGRVEVGELPTLSRRGA